MRGSWLAIAVFVGGCFTSHDDDPDPRCEDRDEDGFGEGRDCAGPDCDDDDATRHDVCEDAGVPACEEGDQEPCYGGPDGTGGIGTCRSGARRCQDGDWTACSDEIVPREETCDGLDDNCDGVVDEGVTSTCGDCDASCHEECAGVGCPAGLTPGPNAILDAEGALIPASEADLTPRLIWIPDGVQDTVHKVRTDTLEILASYSIEHSHVHDWPGPIVMDPRGNAFVAQNTFNATVTRVDASDCPDRDGDGVVRTSSGAQDLLPLGADECVVWSSTFGVDEQVWLHPVIVLTDGGRFLWASPAEDTGAVEMDTETGERTGRAIHFVRRNDIYAMVALGDDLWIGQNREIIRVALDDLEDMTFFLLPEDRGLDLMQADTEGDLVITPGMQRFDVDHEEFENLGDFGESTVGDFTIDAGGDMWFRTYDYLGVRRLDTASGMVDPFPVDAAVIHIVADLDGGLWTWTPHGPLNVYDSGAFDHRGTLFEECEGRPDPEMSCLGYAELLGDPAGLQLRRSYPDTVVRAETLQTFAAQCGGAPGRWAELTWETGDAGDAVIDVRTGDDEAALEAASWTRLPKPALGPAPLDSLAPSRLLQVRVHLTGDAPMLRRLIVRQHC